MKEGESNRPALTDEERFNAEFDSLVADFERELSEIPEEERGGLDGSAEAIYTEYTERFRQLQPLFDRANNPQEYK